MNKIMRFILLLGTVSWGAHAGLNSPFFSYEDAANARGLHVSVKGSDWVLRDVREEDLSFYGDLLSNGDVVRQFGAGTPLPRKKIASWIRDSWVPRFESGKPSGALTVMHTDGRKMGYVIGGLGEGPGVSELACAFMPEFWGKGLATSIASVVNQWAPEVRRIGLGEGLDPEKDKSVMTAFRCFQEQPLSRLDATASPNNPGSWRILDKLSFGPAASKLKSKEVVLDLGTQGDAAQNPVDHILKLYDASHNEPPLEKGVRYQLVDEEGRLRTFSFHDMYNALRYHFERVVD